MSRPLSVNAVGLRNLATALDGITKLTRDTGVRFDGYGVFEVRTEDDGAMVSVRWIDQTDEEDGYYVIDDRSGS